MQQDPAQGAGPPPGAGPGTGDGRVDAALEQLDGLEARPLHEHPAVFGQFYDTMSDVLGRLAPAADPDARGPGGAPGR
jgi:hypothetical protein